tara:strand:+ start:1056 stop:1346 length:291 start_codon:yes stop_codon:yes gene_type:complete
MRIKLNTDPRYIAHLDHEGGLTFIHLEIIEWGKEVLKQIQKDLEQLLSLAKSNGEEMLFFYLPKDQSTKFHELVKPIDESMPFGGDEEYILYGWEV